MMLIWRAESNLIGHTQANFTLIKIMFPHSPPLSSLYLFKIDDISLNEGKYGPLLKSLKCLRGEGPLPAAGRLRAMPRILMD